MLQDDRLGDIGDGTLDTCSIVCITITDYILQLQFKCNYTNLWTDFMTLRDLVTHREDSK
jgi:hypothetical protein